ncbi:MAG: SMI1/KNR4 family protein [Ruminococcaceae bacterium]|nr:SMI1/KNR4 family protein [Oscillospiraceae bacterium]
MYEFFKNCIQESSGLTFSKVSEEAITEAEQRMGFAFPHSLRAFYQEIGYGFFKYDPAFINRIMEPSDVADFVCMSEEYMYVDRSLYPEDELVFMHISGEDFLTVEYSDGKEGVVKYLGSAIAESFADFLKKMIAAPNYFI